MDVNLYIINSEYNYLKICNNEECREFNHRDNSFCWSCKHDEFKLNKEAIQRRVDEILSLNINNNDILTKNIKVK